MAAEMKRLLEYGSERASGGENPRGCSPVIFSRGKAAEALDWTRGALKRPELTLNEKLRFEGVVDFHLVSTGEAIGFVGHADHGHQFREHGAGHARLASGGGVRGNAIAAQVGGAHRDVEHLFGKRV